MGRHRSRRELLRAAGATVGGATLAGCLSGVGSRGGGATVEVGPGGRLVFDPETVRVEPGTTVRWVWRGDNHNIVVSAQPGSASWEGTPGDATVTYGEYYTYERTFSVAGRYAYFCAPHITAGMTGLVVVE